LIENTYLSIFENLGLKNPIFKENKVVPRRQGVNKLKRKQGGVGGWG
jgi:hypothetical protein